MSLKNEAEELRQLAAKIEKFGDDLPRSAREVIHQSGVQVHSTNIDVELRYIGMSDFNVREYIVRDAGRQLGAHIALLLDYEMARPNGVAMFNPRDPFSTRERYTASVHVLAPAQLEKLVQRAIEVGRYR